MEGDNGREMGEGKDGWRWKKEKMGKTEKGGS